MNVFDIPQFAMVLCAIPIYRILAGLTLADTGPRSRGIVLSNVGDALMYFAIAMVLDFLGSLPGLGVGSKSAFGQDVLEPVSHLMFVGALVVGLWKAKQIGTGALWTIVVAAAYGFLGGHAGATDVLKDIGTGLLPAFNWLVTALCLVQIVCLYTIAPKGRFNLLLIFGLLGLAAMASQHDLIAQWANGNAHYPILK